MSTDPVDEVPDGTLACVAGKTCIHFDGYWIRYYTPPKDDLNSKKRLIDSLTRRAFHHTETGINTPGDRLGQAREAYERETDPARKRVNAAMLAGALFNRATDIFTSVVELASRGVAISSDNELMRQCEVHFQEALELGKQVKHYSGHEGIDELWGEPFKAFVLPIGEFYQTRYLKIAQSMRDIDRIARVMNETVCSVAGFEPAEQLIKDFQEQAKLESETMRSDPAIFQVWPSYVAAGEALLGFRPASGTVSDLVRNEAIKLLADGKSLIGYIAGARVPMPKSTDEYLDACAQFTALNKADNVRRLATV